MATIFISTRAGVEEDKTAVIDSYLDEDPGHRIAALRNFPGVDHQLQVVLQV